MWAEVDLGAITQNVERLVALVAPAQLCAVVKANGYGHGAVPSAHAALDGGAAWLAVALVEEGVELRDAGIEAPVLVLSEPPHDAMDEVVGRRLVPTLYTSDGIEAAAKAAASVAGGGPLPVHVKIDTGMRRVGAAVGDAVELCGAVASRPDLRLQGLWTHLAVADEPGNPYTGEQLTQFDALHRELAGRGVAPELLHAANSAGALAHPPSRYDLVRCGIAVYGLPPSPDLDLDVDLQPAMSLKARVSFVKRVDAGAQISYGLRYRFDRPSVVATVPIGYADGVPRRLSDAGAEVLIGGRRRPIAGAVTMDQIMVDCGDDDSVVAGDEVVLLGVQGGERVSAVEWAERLGTISYEVVCGVGPRVPRVYL